MKPLPATPEVLTVARRVVWFKEPEEAIEDLQMMERFVGTAEFLEALDHAPPGVFDPKSWNYWNLKFGRSPAPPMPERKF